MKVLLINGSPHTDGCTNAALTEIATTLQKMELRLRFFKLEPRIFEDALHAANVPKLANAFFQIV